MGPTTTAVTTLIPLTLLLFFTSLLLPTFTLAWTSNAYCCASFATFDEKIFYVEGGVASQGTGLPQFFSLDLTISGWKTSDPPYVLLSGGSGFAVAPSAAYHSMTVSPDGQRLTLWVQQNRAIFTYDGSRRRSGSQSDHSQRSPPSTARKSCSLLQIRPQV
ncbi:hypothetical protein EC957_010865 [Mortierella hygrophila]|uniref:Uncharacterized protein n=1 Tax=Mortierella hygrophila TaxID=979708 RepID=A0A9P6F9G0_9FUNG|nr:hypothetical protein EC957_010865 [Mortierella hygrophila]